MSHTKCLFNMVLPEGSKCLLGRSGSKQNLILKGSKTNKIKYLIRFSKTFCENSIFKYFYIKPHYQESLDFFTIKQHL